MKHNSTPDDFFKNLKAPFQEDKNAIWEKMEPQLQQQPVVRRMRPGIWVAAASLLLIISATAFARFYRVEQVCLAAEEKSITLPDGSVVQMNAASQLSYAPYWWYFKRELHFEGEAFFKVQKGKKFTVISEKGNTSVLGTSFNINSFEKGYTVYCATGRVRVDVGTQSLELHPFEQAMLDQQTLTRKTLDKSHQVAWVQGKFQFNNQALFSVIKELERHYAVEIMLDEKIEATTYSGFFERPGRIEEALNLICLSLNLKFTKVSSNKYHLSTDS